MITRIIEGTGEGTLDVQFLFNENSGLATQSVHSARVGKNDPFCLSLPEQFDSEKDIILSFTETSTGRIIYECEKELGIEVLSVNEYDYSQPA